METLRFTLGLLHLILAFAVQHWEPVANVTLKEGGSSLEMVIVV